MKATYLLSTRASLLAFLPLLAIVLFGCEDHYTTQEAYAICEEAVPGSEDVRDADAFNDCVACREDCGSECQREDTSPPSFACPDEEEDSSGGGGGGS